MASARVGPRVSRGLLVTFVAYFLFALFTDLEDFGLTGGPSPAWHWTAVRISTVAGWLAIAGLIARWRRPVVNWRGFSYSSLAAAVAAFLATGYLFPQTGQPWVLFLSLVFYVLVSAWLCVTLRHAVVAAILGVVALALQLMVDGVAHVLVSGFPPT